MQVRYRPPRSSCLIILVCVLSHLCFSLTISGIISGAILQLRDVFCLSCLYQELVISAMLMGAVLGSLIGGKILAFEKLHDEMNNITCFCTWENKGTDQLH